MISLSRKIAADRVRGDEGNVLVVVMLVSVVIGMLAALALTTGTQADRSSASDRNHEQSLGVAEAGVQQVVSRISAEAAGTDTTAPYFWSIPLGSTFPSTCHQGGNCPAAQNDTSGAYKGSTPQGTYWYWVTRCDPTSGSADPCRTPTNLAADGFVIDAQATSTGTLLQRGRRIEVTLIPPARFPGGKDYAMFSYTSIAIQNNDQVLNGDVFANDNIDVSQSNHNSTNDPTLRGSLTAARGWINLDSSVYITGNVWSGGPNYAQQWAISMGGNSRIDGWARASNTQPGSCNDANYNVPMANGSSIGGSLTTLGVKSTSTGTVGGAYQPNTCTVASPQQPLPTYTFNPKIYGPNTYPIDTCPAHNGVCEFSSVASFQSWLSGNLANFQGAFLVNEAAPAQTSNHRVDLTGAQLTGNTTIITNAPVFTGNLDDSNVAGGSAEFVIVSHYAPPSSTGCDTEHDTSDCAVHIKNNFSLNAAGTCKTATLVYADLGPVAVKNGSVVCGAIESDGILVKNNQQVIYDDRIKQVVGFGNSAYVVSRWIELPVS